MNKEIEQRGQAIIVLVMVVAIVSIIFTHVALLNINALGISNELFDGFVLRAKAEGYLESAAIRYLRDSSYTGETLIEDSISCNINLTDLGGANRDLESSCSRNGRTKKVGMQTSYAEGIYTFTKISER